MTPLEKRRISPSLRCVLPSGSRAVLRFLTKRFAAYADDQLRKETSETIRAVFNILMGSSS